MNRNKFYKNVYPYPAAKTNYYSPTKFNVSSTKMKFSLKPYTTPTPNKTFRHILEKKNDYIKIDRKSVV